MVNHVSLRACEMSNSGLAERKFFDIYEGKLKFLVDLSTSEVLGIAKCFREDEKVLADSSVANTIFKILSMMSDVRLVSPKEKDRALRAQLSMSSTTILKTGKPLSFENSTPDLIDIN